jgi:hypothetical protein
VNIVIDESLVGLYKFAKTTSVSTANHTQILPFQCLTELKFYFLLKKLKVNHKLQFNIPEFEFNIN